MPLLSWSACADDVAGRAAGGARREPAGLAASVGASRRALLTPSSSRLSRERPARASPGAAAMFRRARLTVRPNVRPPGRAAATGTGGVDPEPPEPPGSDTPVADGEGTAAESVDARRAKK